MDQNLIKLRLESILTHIALVRDDLKDLSWLYGSQDFWLENSVFVDQQHNSYGQIKDVTIVKNLAKFSSKSNTSVQTGYSTNMDNWIRANTSKEVRPVITISSKNILAQ